ncbi:FecR family protein [Botryobacter ruber]|uniref:FecR family protein n=1 Tax=Botryobacter ruber TaxID=2171629 RepID=UPI000E0B221F|nr:FecR family protein [Botryobacter ruber]
MTRDEYIKLYEKYLSGRCTPREEELLKNWQDEFELKDQAWETEAMGDQDETKHLIYSRLKDTINQPERGKDVQLRSWFIAASLALLLLSGSVYMLLNKPPDVQEQIANAAESAAEEIAPGTNKAILTLADGSEVELDNTRKGTLPGQGPVRIVLHEGQVAYKDAAGTGNQEEQYNRIATPRGGQYQVVLADGTKVWLNAASSLRFPAAFRGSVRKVMLTGEAYFEVAKNKDKPFKVAVNGMEVEVLGTHFNIMAYENEKDLKTTLLEGAVKVSTTAEKVLLEPGQRAVLNKEKGNIQVGAADVEEAIAWKNGLFTFNNEDIKSIMRKVSRWYDVDVTYQGDMAGKDFAGTVSRSENVTEVLRMLELTGAVHYKIEGRRVTVMP